MQIKELLLRLGTENLIKFIDDDLFKILKIRNTSLASQKNLASLVLKLNSAIKLFKNKISRDLIIYALKEKEAKLIGKLFNLSGENIWNQLIQVDFKKYKNLKILFNIFDIKSEDNLEIISKKDIHIKCGVSEVTINKCFKKMDSIRGNLIPQCILEKYK